MKRSNYLIWFRRLAVLGAVVAGLTASAAGAAPMLDPQDTPANPVASNTTPQGLRADGLRWQGIAKAYQQSRQAPVPDVFERYAATHADPLAGHTTALGVRADGLRWQGIAKAYQDNEQAPVPDVFERYAATHRLATAVGTERIVDDYFRDPSPVVTPAGDRIVDDSFRDPRPAVTPAERIVDDSFRDTARYVPSTSSGNHGLDWGDFGIGAGAMLGLALLVAALGVGTATMRHRAGKLGTS
jgi:hypothetical protein